MDNQGENNFEKYPGTNVETSSENIARAENWKMAMSGETGGEVPQFKGDEFGVAKEENNYYGEMVNDESEKQFDSDLAEASNILNFGLDSVARTYGVEATINKIKGFDASGRADPIGDLFLEFGIDTKHERDDFKDESEANALKVDEARRETNASSQSTSAEAARHAIEEMKELISEVEGADSRYENIRDGARSAGMGYFEYAIKDYNTRGLAELFQVLINQKDKDETDSEAVESDKSEEDSNEEFIKTDTDPNDEVQLNPEILK